MTTDHLTPSATRPGWQPVAVLVGALLVALVAATDSLPVMEFAFVVAGGLTVAIAHRLVLSWRVQLAMILVVILFIPIRRYVVPGGLPFELEPYRILVAVTIVLWAAALLTDPRVSLRKTKLEAPLALLVASVLASVIANPGRVADVSSDVTKELSFLLSFILLFYMVVSVVRTEQAIRSVIRLLVGGGAVIGVLAMIETRTGYNPFHELAGVIPFIELVRIPDEELRGSGVRAFGPAQHPIALGAALAMLVPLAVYLARAERRRIWWVAAAALSVGVFASLSRTSILMLVAAGAVLLWLRPREIRRFLIPALVILPVLIHFALPGVLGATKKSFFPEGGLLADQQTSVGSRGQGRVADLGPALEEFAQRPFVGQGFGTRVEDAARANAQILDNQWLLLLLETGVLGAIAFGWLVLRSVRLLAGAARSRAGPDGWLPASLAASLTGMAVGMLTFDSFAFVQATFIMWIFIALGSATVLLYRDDRVTSRPPTTPPTG